MIVRCAGLLLALAGSCSGGSGEPASGGAEAKPPPTRVDLPPPAKAEPAAPDIARCDRALKHARKCIEDSRLDADAKSLATVSVVSLSELWAMHPNMPLERQQVMCERVLEGVGKIVKQTACTDVPPE